MERQTRSTKQRSIMLAKLCSVHDHPTADELYARVRVDLPRLSLGTVYRNLDLLVRQGLVRCIDCAGLQKRFDGNLAPHHHVRCVECGRIGDVYGDIPLPDFTRMRVDGFTLTGADVLFSGECAQCARCREAQ